MMTEIYKLMQTISPCSHNLSDTSIRNMKKTKTRYNQITLNK